MKKVRQNSGDVDILEGLPEADEKRIPVRVIARLEGAALVEWVIGKDAEVDWARGYIPVVQIAEDGTVAQSDLDAAAPYGLHWESVIGAFTVTERDIARELRRGGIWTEKDIRTRPRDVEAAFRRALYISISDILSRCKR